MKVSKIPWLGKLEANLISLALLLKSIDDGTHALYPNDWWGLKATTIIRIKLTGTEKQSLASTSDDRLVGGWLSSKDFVFREWNQ